MQKNWIQQTKIPTLESKVLSEELNGLSLPLCDILIRRGIDNFEKAKSFFRPHWSALHNPFLMKDMQNAVDRIQAAIANKENILIYGDYDVDGTTSVAMTYTFFSQFYDQIDYYIPDRYAEGYGISYQGIDYASDNDISLIIALDCGIKAIDKIEYAKQKGIDFIICDHHRPGDTIPEAVAVLDPKRQDCQYPFKELSGCGVGFKLIQAFAEAEKIEERYYRGLLDFLAVSICADIVPLIGENRVLCYFGLQQLNQEPSMGFRYMLKDARFEKSEMTVMDVVFIIAPRINAAGRIANGRKAVELMISKDEGFAREMSQLINQHNIERKELDQQITKEALAKIESSDKLISQKTTVLYQENWHKGVIGIVASRCIEKYYRPTIILTESKGMAAGSARSVQGFDVYQALEQCTDVLEQFGGHMYAAGMTLPIENIAAFQEKFEEVVSSTIEDSMLTPQVEIDAELHLDEINARFYKVMKQFAPFGPENMKPVFMSKGIKDKGYAKLVGKNNEHLKLTVYHPNNPELSFAAIGFGLGHHYALVKSGKPFDCAYVIDENEWNGRKSLQLVLKDLRESGNN